VSYNSINLTWTDNSDTEEGFMIERAAAGESFMEIAAASPDIENYMDTGLEPSTTYYYRICAFNYAGHLGYSDTVSATTENNNERNEWYIDNTASGNNNGTSWTNAWNSFASINWNLIQPGDVIYICGGSTEKIYIETLTIGKSGTQENPITIKTGQSEGHNGMVIIDAENSRDYCIPFEGHHYVSLNGSVNNQIRLKLQNAHVCGIFNPDSTGIVIKYIEIENCGTLPDDDWHYSDAIVLNWMHGCEIAYCYIHNNYDDAVRGTGSSGGYGSNKVHHNFFINNGDDGLQIDGDLDVFNNTIGGGGGSATGHPDGIQILGSYVRVWNNVFFDNSNSNIFVDPVNRGAEGGTNYRIYNNLIYQTDEDTSVFQRGIQILCEPSTDFLDDLVCVNNTFVNIEWVPILVGGKENWHRFTNVIIANNIVSNCCRGIHTHAAIQAFESDYDENDVIIDYNLIDAGSEGHSTIIYKDISYTHEEFSASGLGQANGLTGDPFFTNPSGYEFYLTADSPAVNAGLNPNIYDDLNIIRDLDFNYRPIGDGWDLGAFEFVE
jgi:hypothetical protein